MSRQQLESACREIGYEPEPEDRDTDLLSVLIEAHYFEERKAA